jgi:hypothetical protein
MGMDIVDMEDMESESWDDMSIETTGAFTFLLFLAPEGKLADSVRFVAVGADSQ